MARQGDRGGGRELSVVGGVVIRPDWSLWLLLGLAIVLLAALGLFSGAQALAADGHRPVLAALGALGGLVGAALLLTGLLRWATIIYPDRIERRGLFAVRDLRKADIAGYRRIKPRNGPAYLKLSSKAPGVKPLAVYIFSKAAAFDQWLVGIPDLDAADLAAATQALMANPTLGADPFQREARLAQLRLLSRGSSVLAVGLGIWVAVWPRPYGVAIGLVMILPLIALAIAGWSRGLVALVFSKTDPRPNLGAPLFLGVVLLIRAMDANLLDWRPTLVAAVALGAALTVIAVATDPKLWAIKSNLFSAGLMLTLYAGSSVVLVDRLADNTHPKVFATQVRDMWVRHGKSTSYNLKLAPWGPVATVDSVSVSASTYQQTSVGQTVCVGLHPGAFALRWFVLQACEGLVTTESDRSPRPGLAQLPNADAMAALYPDAAARANVTGRAQFRCTVTSDGGLTDCVIVSESPPAYGFGDATLKLAKLLRMEPVGPDGASTAGQSLVETVVWRLPGAAASAPTSATGTPAPPPNPG